MISLVILLFIIFTFLPPFKKVQRDWRCGAKTLFLFTILKIYISTTIYYFWLHLLSFRAMRIF